MYRHNFRIHSTVEDELARLKREMSSMRNVPNSSTSENKSPPVETESLYPSPSSQGMMINFSGVYTSGGTTEGSIDSKAASSTLRDIGAKPRPEIRVTPQGMRRSVSQLDDISTRKVYPKGYETPPQTPDSLSSQGSTEAAVPDDEFKNRTVGWASKTVGFNNRSLGFASTAMGKDAKSRLRTQQAHSGGSFLIPGDNQITKTIVMGKTSSSEECKLKIDKIDDYILFGSSSQILIKITTFGSTEDHIFYCDKKKGVIDTYTKNKRTFSEIRILSHKKECSVPGVNWEVGVSIDYTGGETSKPESDGSKNNLRPTLSIVVNTSSDKETRWMSVIEAFEIYHKINLLE